MSELSSDVAEWLRWLTDRNYSPRTVDGRRKYLAVMVAWLEERGVTDPREVTLSILERYQAHLAHRRKANGQPLSWKTQAQALIPVKGLFGWLARTHRIASNPASELVLPRTEHRLPKDVLTADEAQAVMEVPNTDTTLGLRNRAMLELFYSSGLRRLELAGLRLADLDRARSSVFVNQGKGHRDRHVPVSTRAMGWLVRYLEESRPRLMVPPDEGRLFIGRRGEPICPDRITAMVRDAVEQAASGKHGSCHLLRHTMATLMLEGGADIRYVQAMLGHTDLASTQVYTKVSVAKLAAVHAACHPAGAPSDDDEAGE